MEPAIPRLLIYPITLLSPEPFDMYPSRGPKFARARREAIRPAAILRYNIHSEPMAMLEQMVATPLTCALRHRESDG
jgi:hypothetical protein